MAKIPIEIRYKVGDEVETVEGFLLWKSGILMGNTIFVRKGDYYIGINPNNVIDYNIPADKLPAVFLQNTDNIINQQKQENARAKMAQVVETAKFREMQAEFKAATG